MFTVTDPQGRLALKPPQCVRKSGNPSAMLYGRANCPPTTLRNAGSETCALIQNAWKPENYKAVTLWAGIRPPLPQIVPDSPLCGRSRLGYSKIHHKGMGLKYSNFIPNL